MDRKRIIVRGAGVLAPAALLCLTIQAIGVSEGWPLFLMACCGCVITVDAVWGVVELLDRR